MHVIMYYVCVHVHVHVCIYVFMSVTTCMHVYMSSCISGVARVGVNRCGDSWCHPKESCILYTYVYMRYMYACIYMHIQMYVCV